MSSAHHQNKTDKTVYWIIGGLTVLGLFGIGLFTVKEQKQAQAKTAITTYTTQESEKPTAVITSTSADFGTMKVSDEKQTDFVIENHGTKPLQLSNINASCDCTFGQITINGVKSPEFTMHAKSDWVGTVEPGQSATLTVIYRPSVMPVKGSVSRQVTVATNDPANPQLAVSIKAVVE